LIVALSSYAPHICEELWSLTGHEGSVLDQAYPAIEHQYLAETSKLYPIAINGKTRAEMELALDATQQDVEGMVLAHEVVKKWLDGKTPRKIIYVKHKMINVVV
jgi:leucyl-tRNA synthetase